jgi:hypothetical protein
MTLIVSSRPAIAASISAMDFSTSYRADRASPADVVVP